MHPELPLDLAHLDDLREQIIQADEAIVSFVCLRVQLAREELAYRRERGLPEVDRAFDHRERTRIMDGVAKHPQGFGAIGAEVFAEYIQFLARHESGAVDDGRIDPNTDDLGF